MYKTVEGLMPAMPAGWLTDWPKTRKSDQIQQTKGWCQQYQSDTFLTAPTQGHQIRYSRLTDSESSNPVEYYILNSDSVLHSATLQHWTMLALLLPKNCHSLEPLRQTTQSTQTLLSALSWPWPQPSADRLPPPLCTPTCHTNARFWMLPMYSTETETLRQTVPSELFKLALASAKRW